MRAALVLVLVGSGVAGSLCSRYVGLLSYLWFSFFRPQEWVWGTLDPLRLSVVAGLAFVIPALVTGVFPNISHVLTIGSLLFLGACTLAHQFAVRPDISWMYLDQLARVIVVSLLLVTIVKSPRRFAVTLAVVAGSLALHSSKLGVVFVFSGGARFTAGPGGSFGDNNDFGLAIARILPLLVVAAQTLPWRPARWGFAIAVPLSLLGLIATYSRGAFLAMGTGILVLLVLQRRRLAVMIAIAAAVAVLIWLPRGHEYVNRINSIQTYDEAGDPSAIGRLHFWRVALDVVRDYPFGVGLRNFEEMYDRFDTSNGAYGQRRSVHSTHLQIMAEAGYAGFAVYVLMLLASAAILVRIRRRALTLSDCDERRFFVATANGLLASLAAFVVGGSFLAQALNDLNWIGFALVAAFHRLPARAVEKSVETLDVNGVPASAWGRVEVRA